MPNYDVEFAAVKFNSAYIILCLVDVMSPMSCQADGTVRIEERASEEDETDGESDRDPRRGSGKDDDAAQLAVGAFRAIGE